MLKDAALLTLQIQKTALEHGMSLKDASAFNIQFHKGRPILIDSLSFEKYDEGKPWIAYKQFVEHFLCPLSLMSLVDIRSNRLMSIFLDGLPVDLVSSMLPAKSKFNLSLLFHIHAHASAQKKNANKKLGSKLQERTFSKRALLGLLGNVEGAVKGLKWAPVGTQWEDYYEEEKNNYRTDAMKHKATLVEQYLKTTKPKIVWDMGANTGFFSKIAAKDPNTQVISCDIDYGALEKNYHDVKASGASNILPLFSDFTNPTPAVGWENEERDSLIQRGPADTVLALALTHHLAISNNLPFSNIASGFAKIAKTLIVEFIEKKDSQVQILLANRKDIFTHYTKEDFEQGFQRYFTIKKATAIKSSKRILYLMERKYY
jgi:predicted nicotinamide N-methyase